MKTPLFFVNKKSFKSKILKIKLLSICNAFTAAPGTVTDNVQHHMQIHKYMKGVSPVGKVTNTNMISDNLPTTYFIFHPNVP